MTNRWLTARRKAAAVLLSAGTLAAGALVAAPSSATLPAANLPQAADAEHGFYDETILWDSETDPLENYHVHGLAVTPQDTILAFTEGRHETCDAGPRELLLRRSTDAGASWEPSQVVVPAEEGQSWGNPSPVVDQETGDIFVFFGMSLRDQGNTTCSGDRQEVFMVHSDDDGLTWTDPVEMPELFEDNDYGWTLHGPGPGHGIQLDDGRLALQVLHRREVIGHTVPERLYGVSLIYSDDHGDTWEAGEPIPVDIDYPINESRIWQRDDGAVVVNGRSAAGGHRNRISAVSTDGGITWSDPVLEPATGRYTAVDAGFVQFTGADGVSRVLHSRPDSARREALTIGVSYDDGYTYRYEKMINAGSSYYSDMAVLADGTIVLIYGRDGEILSAPQRVAVATFDLAWLTDGRDDGSNGGGVAEQAVELGATADVRTRPGSRVPRISTITPDISAHRNHAAVTGSPTVTKGAVGSALELSADDHLQIPLTRSVASAGDEFTTAAWFRTEEQSSQAIMWAYAMGSSTPQWWIRAEPGDNRLRALVDTGAGTRALTAPGNYADGEWHHVALTRDRDAVTLYLDGEAVASGASPVGSVSSNAREGIHIGQRPDGANALTGGIDETLLFDRVLSPAEIAGLVTDGASNVPDDAVVHLPLERTRSNPDRPGGTEVVEDENARGGRYLQYDAQAPGDYVEIPFTVDGAGEYEIAVRYHRHWNRGKVQVSIDGTDLPDGLVDPTLPANAAYQTYQHGTVHLRQGGHRIRFTLVGEGHQGGTTIGVDHLTLISGGGDHDLIRDVVVDDESVGDFQMVSGTWSRATGQAGHPYYGVSYRSAPAGTGDRLARFRLDVPVAGEYQVLAWYVSHPNRASNAPYTINHADGSTTVRVDQRGQARSLADADRPGVWVNLGTYRFEAGSSGSVELSNDADGFVVADGITLTRDPVPDTPDDVQAAAASSSSIDVTWTAREGATGYHVERRPAGTGAWELAGETPAGETTFTSTGLSPGTAYEHRVYAITATQPGRPDRGSMASDPVSATTNPAGDDGEDDESLRLTTLSGRPDTVSGGDSLIRIDVGEDIALDDVAVQANDLDVTADFVVDEDARTLTGVVTGLNTGDNVVAATGGESRRSQLVVVNHPTEGPVFSGPHQQPFACETTSFTMPVIGGNLGAPLDENCSVQTRVDYFYRTTGDTYAPWPDGASSYPDDMATTTTSTGDDAPFVVRMETGTVNRSIYQHTVLHDPLTEPEPSFDSPPAAWNGAAIFTLGGGCTNGWYRQGRNTGGVVDAFMLGQGYGVMSSSLNVFGSNCSDLTAAESAMMVKERFIETYGPAKHVIGFGSSGGSYQAYQTTDNYPGIFDGIIIGSSFPDVGFSTVNMITDAWLLDTYFASTDTEWTEEEQRAATGFATYATAGAVSGGARRIDPRSFCGIVPAAQRYHPDTNPTGVRCGVYDHAVNVYGRDPATGFARRPLDNVGIQYGLQALNDGTISPEQFLDLNEHVGGFDHDANIRPERTAGDQEAIRIAYQTGRLASGGGGLAGIPVIDYRAYRDDNPNGELHLRYHTFSMKERMAEANGTSANYVSLLEDIRYGGFSTDSPMLRHAIIEMDDWLTAIAADTSGDAPIDKIVRARPADLVEGCNTRDTNPVFIAETLDRDPAGECEQLYPTASFPREVAGESVAADVVKCQLKAPDPEEYAVQLDAEQWDRLEAIFPGGVCDYSKPGVEQQGLSDTWLRF
ncbi:hypothetical protein G1H11_00310 [Phytoactinopolyspora alkaliphila]|uniref:exo-alpha-sialidase n=1 Tax=Phytoactinopolyspora alkaliphila TaxID=1783498 RepID=A0A6N9YFS3_9ACTN|nr:DUF6351 family protein [Phytoactinopolyspora alkaliphila]NED93755.1 hypothetical protein [Phytoactinopolyspora alkaliphila]